MQTEQSSQRRGITITELLVSTAIVGILAALIVPAVMRARQSARSMEAQNNMRQIVMAAQQHEETFGGYKPIPLPNFNASGAGLYSYHDVLRAHMDGYPLAENINLASMNPDGTNSHWKTARGIGFMATDGSGLTGANKMFIDPTLPEDVQRRQGGFGFYSPVKDPFSAIKDFDQSGLSNRPFVFTRKTDTAPGVSPDAEESIPAWRKWLDVNKSVNWVDAIATPGGTDAGIDTKRHSGTGLIGFADGHIERVNEQRAREIDDKYR